jgi:16S rRNA (uracil1498-N3)-methyltransferase
VRDALHDARTNEERVIVALGPEGGFTDRERKELEEAGFVAVGMSERALKSEVATIALLALVHDALRA